MPTCLKAAATSVGKSPLCGYVNLISPSIRCKPRAGTCALSPLAGLANSFSKRKSGGKPQMLAIQCHLPHGCSFFITQAVQASWDCCDYCWESSSLCFEAPRSGPQSLTLCLIRPWAVHCTVPGFMSAVRLHLLFQWHLRPRALFCQLLFP